MLGIISLKNRARGVSIFNAFNYFPINFKVPFFKLVAITTDSARAMIGFMNGFAAICQKK